MPTFRAGFPLNLGPQFEELRDEIDRVWTSLTAPSPPDGGLRPSGGTYPPVNVHESDDAIVVEAELPGLDAGDVDVSVADDELVLKGARPDPTAAADAASGDGARPAVTWHRRERGVGGFERRIPLPMAVDAARVEARLVNGVLTITCPKAPQCQPRKVAVQTS